MKSDFYLICFGVLGCYAGLRTVRAGWARGAIAMVLVACLVHLLFDVFMPGHRRTESEKASISAPAAPQGVNAFFHEKLADLEADRCVLGHLEETPLSPLAYVVELHSVLDGYKRLQAAHIQGGGHPETIGALASATFSDTARGLSPKEIAAIDGNGDANLETLCAAFGKWTETLAQKSKPEQKEIWRAFQGTLGQAQ